MKIEIQFGSKKHSLELQNDQTVTVGDLREAVYLECRVLPKDQKLLGRSKLSSTTEDSVLLLSLDFKVDAVNRLMLIGSTVVKKTQALQASDALLTTQTNATKHLLRKIPSYFWALGCYGGLLTDAYGAGRNMELNSSNLHLVVSIVALDTLLERLNPLGPLMDFPTTNASFLTYTEAMRGGREAAEVSLSNRLLEPLLDNPVYHRSFRLAHGVLRRSVQFMVKAGNAITPSEVLEVVEGCISDVDHLSPQSWLMLPAGWRGKSADNVFFILITRETKEERFTMVVVNRGNEGSTYHRRWPTAEKVKVCPLLTLHHIEKEKMLDKCFWLVLLSLWIRRNDPHNQSEFIREEVFYDVLLPWLLERKPLLSSKERRSEDSLLVPCSSSGFPDNVVKSSKVWNEKIGKSHSERDTVDSSGEKIDDGSPKWVLTTNPSLLQPYNAYLEQCGCTPPRRRESSTVKSALTAFCWLMCEFSDHQMIAKEVKQVKFAVKLEAYHYAAQDLVRIGRLLVGGENDFFDVPSSSLSEGSSRRNNNSCSTAQKNDQTTDAPTTQSRAVTTTTTEFCVEVLRSGKRFVCDDTDTRDIVHKGMAQRDGTTCLLENGDAVRNRRDTYNRKEEVDGEVQMAALEDALGKLEALGVKNSSKNGLHISELWRTIVEEKSTIRSASGLSISKEKYQNKIVLVYVAAYMSPGVPQFSELLANATANLLHPTRCTTHPVELLFVSLDEELELFDKHASMFSFHRVSFPAISCAHRLDVYSSFELLLFSPSGALIHRAGVSSLRADPMALTFPSGACWRGAQPLSFTDQNCIGMGTSVLAHCTQKGLRHGTISDRASERVLELLDRVQGVLKELPRDQVISMYNTTPERQNSELLTVSSEGEKKCTSNSHKDEWDTENALSTFLGSVELRNAISKKLTIRDCGQQNTHLLSLRNTFTHLGRPYEVTLPYLVPVYRWEVATSFASLHAQLQEATTTVQALWKRAGHSSTSSRVAEQMHIIEFITWIMTQKVPVPSPPSIFSRMESTDEERKVSSTFYLDDRFPTVNLDREGGEVVRGMERRNPPRRGASTLLLMPGPRDAASKNDKQDQDMQFDILHSLYYLTLSLANAWQAVETPTRRFDAERTLVAMHILVVFDAVARQRAGSARCQLLSNLLHFEGGYYPSTTLSVSNIPFETLSASLELTQPHFLPVRSAIISYLSFLRHSFSHEIYDFPMPSNTLLEATRDSHSVHFLRLFVDNAGISFVDESQSKGVSEMERLMECFCSPESSLVVQFPEFLFFRDMVFLTKFLGTMETRESHLLRRRKEVDRFSHWRLSFEESTPGWQMSAGWRTTPTPPQWECVLVRGRNMDIADIRVTGFGDRELHYGEGMMMLSPIDVGRLMEVQKPTEDDILHARTLPSFGGSLNQEEAEMVLSFLTTPYLRIPLLLDFFSSGDRSSHLFVKEVQEVLRAALFEPGAYSSGSVSLFSLPACDMKIPLPHSLQGAPSFSFSHGEGLYNQGERLPSNGVVENTSHRDSLLGTTHGLLLNELIRDPHPVLGPLWHLLQKTTAIGSCSIYSTHASYIFFIIELICDVLAYSSFALSMTTSLPRASKSVIEMDQSKILNFFEHEAYPWFIAWAKESAENDDTPTECVVLNERSMVDRVLWKAASEKLERLRATPGAAASPATGEEEVSEGPLEERAQEEKKVEEVACRHLRHMLQSCAFVRAHHGFGMGLQRTQLSMQHGDEVLSPEENLLRFLQSQGLRVPPMVQPSALLEKVRKLMMCGGRRRAVFLQITSTQYKDTVRLPNLFRHSPQSTQDARHLKLPPCDVMENRVFFILLDGYPTISAYIRSLSPPALSEMMEEVVHSVLRQTHRPPPEINDPSSGVLRDGKSSTTAGATTKAVQKGIVDPLSSPADSAAMTTSTITTSSPPSASSWTLGQSADIIVGPSFSGLIFHFRSGELFWRQKELKPVPDSMSHFSDYEAILGNELRQCGEVLRHQHRHWVQVVGTPYDLMEWSAPNTKENDCGESCPRIMEGNWPDDMVEAAVWEDVVYNRIVAVGEGEGQQPWPVERERWAVHLVRLWMEIVVRDVHVFPLAPSLQYMKQHSTSSSYSPRGRRPSSSPAEGNQNVQDSGMVTTTVETDATKYATQEETKVEKMGEEVEEKLSEMHFLLNDAPQYASDKMRATWKECVVYQYPEPYLEVYNLVPHARCMYRSLIFSSNQKFSLHSLSPLPMTWKDRKDIRSKAFAAGDFTSRIYCESSLEIHRYNELLNGREMYMPPRLLQGVLPGVLLEAFAFWIGEDNVIRGYTSHVPHRKENRDELDMKSTSIEVDKIVRTSSTENNGTSPLSVSSSFSSNSEVTTEVPATTVKKETDNTTSDPTTTEDALDQWHQFSVEVFLKGGNAFLIRRNDHYYTPIFDYLPYYHHSLQADDPSQRIPGKPSEWQDEMANEEEKSKPGESRKGVKEETTTYKRTEEKKNCCIITPEWSRNVSLLRAAIHEPHEVCAAILDQFHGDAHQGVQWALDPRHADSRKALLEKMMASAEPSSAESPSFSVMSGSLRGRSFPSSVSKRIRSGIDLVLVNIRSYRHLHPLFSLLTGLEDASHILVWARRLTRLEEEQKNSSSISPYLVSVPSERDGEEDGCLCIESVEIPRLRARFLLQHEGGVSTAPLHFFLVDYPGWRLAETADLHPAILKKLSSLRESFQQSILLCNAIHEVAIMVPNHSFTLLCIANDPRNPFLLFDRSNFSWQQAVPTPFYLYTLHSCGSIVVPQTLSASLYLAALQCGTQHYAEAITTLEACYTDTSFTHEESFMFDLFQFTQEDTSPDATAVRLKAAHALQYSPNRFEWVRLEVELHRYIQMIRHVSSDCRLTFNELLDLIKKCERPSLLVQMQLKVHHARVKEWPETSSAMFPLSFPVKGVEKEFSGEEEEEEEGSATTMTTCSIPSVTPVGLYWDRLLLQPWRRIAPQKLHRVTFYCPYGLETNTGAIEFLWKDLLLADEESGSNSRLGFFFLYNVQLETINVRIGMQDCTKSFAALMGRWFHLRHARWGQEVGEKGDGPLGPSWCATVLQLMALFPHAGWPTTNLVIESFALHFGVPLGSTVFDDPHHRYRAPSSIPGMFKEIERVAEKCFHMLSDTAGSVAQDFSSSLDEETSSLLKRWRESRPTRRLAWTTNTEYAVQFSIPKALPSVFTGSMRHRNSAQSEVTVWPFALSMMEEAAATHSGMPLPFSMCSKTCAAETLSALAHQPLLEVAELKNLILLSSSSARSGIERNTRDNRHEGEVAQEKEKKSTNEAKEEDEEEEDNHKTNAEEDGMEASSLPFNLRDHPLAGSTIAQGMLQRLEKDFTVYTTQRRQIAKEEGRHISSVTREGWEKTSTASLSCLPPDVVHTILFSPDSTTVAQAFSSALQPLEAAADALRQLRKRDQEAVSTVTSAILSTANALIPPPPVRPSGVSPSSMPSTTSMVKNDVFARQRELDAAPTTDPQWVQHRLLLYHRNRVPFRIEWLCGGLLSTELEQEIDDQNPYHGDVAQLRCHLVLLMLLSNRSHLAMQALASIQQVMLFLQLCRLLRGIPDELVHVDAGVQLASIAQRTRELHILFALEISPTALEALVSHCARFAAEVKQNKKLRMEVPRIPEDVRKLLYNRLWYLGDSVRQLLSAQRFFVHSCEAKDAPTLSTIPTTSPAETTPPDTCYILDPRFLLMEFLFNILLRRRQVEMTLWFMDELRAGRSRVQQMIMGQGKTSVVAPLLTLMLTDGRQLVTQVMPTALVEQTRAVLRRCFGVVMVKHVFTLQFDRTCVDEGSTGSWEVESLLTKLQSAVADRAVVVAAPESLKSLFLKYIEQLHLLESIVPYVPRSQDPREIALATQGEERAKTRARIADAIAPILSLWRDGVLLMDEVDVLLHPLRSELNFPIGEKDSIDMSGPRWALPIHLLDLLCSFRSTASSSTSSRYVLYAVRHYQKSHAKRLKDLQRQQAFQEKSKRESGAQASHALAFSPVHVEPTEDLTDSYHEVVHAFHAALLKGVRQHSLQREPHLVLLDLSFYEEELLPLWITWAQLWVLEEFQGYLHKQVLPCRAPWNRFDTMRSATLSFFYNGDRMRATKAKEVSQLLEVTPAYGIKLLNLAHDWLHRLLPHVLGKINRVNFGLLQPSDLQRFSTPTVEMMPLSRKLTAVPFVAKDVPSTSSEFAHPDVAIGLTILAFRYEGLRRGDTKRLLQELKKDFSHQLGPKNVRPAALQYQEWIQRSLEMKGARGKEEEEEQEKTGIVRDGTVEGAAHDSPLVDGMAAVLPTTTTTTTTTTSASFPSVSLHLPTLTHSIPSHTSAVGSTCGEIVPLPQLQITDTYQLNSVHQLLHHVPDVVYFYLTSLVFPRTMLFNRLKVSACGHELGSSVLFGRRIGFSGTPSDLLPMDLGACAYEVGSDARVLSVLTDPEVVRVEVLEEEWTPLRVLNRIAAAQPPFYALIDAGALITNMSNPDVASYLLARLPPYLFDGVVFLDERDEQMVQQRSSGIAVPLAQSGIPVSRRFSFFDQVHTTGTDVKQAASATAVMTLGKDLTFRDYAQGAYRMRGIGNGQKLCLYLIPEVMGRMKAMLCPSSSMHHKRVCGTGEDTEKKEETTFESGDLLRDVPAWLMLNSMKMESLQYLKLSLQELSNVWRKKAYDYLLADSLHAAQHADIFTVQRRGAMFRVHRVEVCDRPSTTWQQQQQQHGQRQCLALPTLVQMRVALEEFREKVGYPVPTTFEAPRTFQTHVEELLAPRPALLGAATSTIHAHDDEEEEGKERERGSTGGGSLEKAISPTSSPLVPTFDHAVEDYPRPRELPLEEVVGSVMERLHFFLRRQETVTSGRERTAVEESDEGGSASSRFPLAYASPTRTENTFTDLSLNAEITHEQEAEEQQEQEAEEEEQRVTFFSRDDEDVLPWRFDSLTYCGANPSSTIRPSNGACFYQLREFTPQQYPPGQMLQQLDPCYLLSDNYFRLEWSGLGERRLKNAVLFMEWTPITPRPSRKREASREHSENSNAAVSEAVWDRPDDVPLTSTTRLASPNTPLAREEKVERIAPEATHSLPKCFGLLNLVEAESIRWLLHHARDGQTPSGVASSPVGSSSTAGADVERCQTTTTMPSFLRRGDVALRLVRTGRCLVSTAAVSSDPLCPLYYSRAKDVAKGKTNEEEEEEEEPDAWHLVSGDSTSTAKDATIAALLFRFVNNEMFFTDQELDVLLHDVFSTTPPADRLRFFKACLRCRRRLTQRWEDTPVATLFFSPEDLPFRTQVSALFFLQNTLEAMVRKALECDETEFHGKACTAALLEQARQIDEHVQQCHQELGGAAVSAMVANHHRCSSPAVEEEKETTTTTKAKNFLPPPQGNTPPGVAIAFLASLLKKHFPKETSPFHTQDIEEVLIYAARKHARGVSSSSSSSSLSLRDASAVLENHPHTESVRAREALLLQDSAAVDTGRAESSEAGTFSVSPTYSSASTLTVEQFYQLFPWIDPHYLSSQREALQERIIGEIGAKGKDSGTDRTRKKRSTEPWNCPVCTLENEAAFATCSACGTRRVILSEEEEEEKGESEDSPWGCEACTFINDSRRHPACSVCLTPNPKVLHTPSPMHGGKGGGSGSGSSHSTTMMDASAYCPDDHWVCSLEYGGCSKVNPKTEFYCSACEKSRPGLAHVRF